MSSNAGGTGGLRRLWWSLAGRVWTTNLVLVLLMAALGVLAISRLSVLERSVNRVLSRNYRSIEAAQGMMAAVAGSRTGDLTPAQAEAQFNRWLEVERRNLSEPAEDRIATAIAADGAKLFHSVSAADSRERIKRIQDQLAELIALNEHAMFSADRHTVKVARALRTEELAIAILAVAVLAASSYVFARTLVMRPLERLLGTLRRIDTERSLRAMSPPPRTAELAALADEFNAMVGRLQRGYAARLGELDRERSKTAAIIESVEDGLIVLDHQGAIVHINEVARAILDLEGEGLVGSGLEKLGETSPHVARLLA
ncbi:MAG: HAMP domain-containing protein, partial [Candidatus Binataceae bacterium]